MKDQQTHDYFDQFTPHYNPKRFNFALNYINALATDEQCILDIGCGDGAALDLIKTHTPLKKVIGLDISNNYLRKAHELVGCDTIQGSILDRELVDEFRENFDYCTCGSIIHHLIGKNRQESFQNAKACLENAIELLKPGGSLIIFEPCHGPPMLMDLIFWIKKTVGNSTNKRIQLFKRWANIGPPVVSYYTPEQLDNFLDSIPNAQIVSRTVIDEGRLGLVIHRVGMGIIAKKMALHSV